MLHTLAPLLAPAVMERLTLVVNHVVGSEPVAVARLRPHAGRTIELRLEGWPTVLPPCPAMAFQVTPAGLFEWCGLQPPGAPALRLRLDASNPARVVAQALAGHKPAVDVEGDAALAAEVNWLITELRWDVAADLERVFGPVAGAQLHQLGRTLAAALRGAMDAWSGLGARLRPGRA